MLSIEMSSVEIPTVKMRGYGKLSQSMSENNHIIFKIFANAALRDILFQQAQLVQLEATYQEIAKSDRDSGDADRVLFDIDVGDLSADDNNGVPNRQWALALEIRSGLKQYCSFLVFRDTLNAMTNMNLQLRQSSAGKQSVLS